MSLSAEIKRQFFRAAQDNPDLQKRPVVKVELEMFRQILAPVNEYLKKDPVYGQYDVSISRQIAELRKMCAEAQAAHTTDNSAVKERRAKLLNVLQSVMESVKEAENV